MLSHLNPASRAAATAPERLPRRTVGVLRWLSSDRPAPAAPALIARELRQNAGLLGQAEDWQRTHLGALEPEQRWLADHAKGWRAVRTRVSVESWSKNRIELRKLHKKAPALWEEVARAYDELTDYRESHVPRVTKLELESLAARLDDAKL